MKTARFQTFLKAMVTAMRRANGVGLAANQLGFDLRALVMECAGNKRYPRVGSFPLQTYLNARIVSYSKEKERGWEGCLSIPGYRGLVPRSKRVTFEATLPNGRRVHRTLNGFEARVLQHEVDHLDGHFYVDRMPDLKHWLHLDEFNRHFGRKIRDRKT
jgi:peptide deformylase